MTTKGSRRGPLQPHIVRLETHRLIHACYVQFPRRIFPGNSYSRRETAVDPDHGSDHHHPATW